MDCPQCHFPIDDEKAEFCLNCGTSFSSPDDIYNDDETIDYRNGLDNVISGRLAMLICGMWKLEAIGVATNFYNMSLDNARSIEQQNQYRVVHKLKSDHQKLLSDIS